MAQPLAEKGGRGQACPERSCWRSLSQRRGAGGMGHWGKMYLVPLYTPTPLHPYTPTPLHPCPTL
ncbi:MAG: hypothetical protein ACRAVC_08780 [Trichormus sp.]